MKKLLAVSLLWATAAFASSVTIVTTSGPGSLSDQVARHIQPLLEKELNTEVVVMNSPGANGLIGLRSFHQLKGDHILIGSFAVPFVAKTMPQKEFDPMVDFVPVTGLTHAPMHILVPANSPAKDLQGLVALSNAKGKLKGGSSHPSANISMTLLDKATGSSTEQINYKQGSQLYAELASGLLDYTFGGATSSAMAMIQSGHLRSLGRLDQIGIPDFSWTALFVKAGNENNRVAVASRKIVNSENMAVLPQPFFRADFRVLQRMIEQEYKVIPAP